MDAEGNFKPFRLQKPRKTHQFSFVSPHADLAAKERRKGRKLAAKDGKEIRFMAGDGHIHGRAGRKRRKNAVIERKGTGKADVRRKDGIPPADAGERLRMTCQRGAYAFHEGGEPQASVSLPVQGTDVPLQV